MNRRVSCLEWLLSAPTAARPAYNGHHQPFAAAGRVLLLERERYSGCPPPELCLAFDQAVEFAACEGLSIAEAIRNFFADDDWGPAQAALEKIVRPRQVARPVALPVMPRAVSVLLKTTDENATVDELERIAATDPVLAARLLSASNSAKYGSRFQIVRLRDAVMRLGVPEARKTLVAACLSGLFASAALRELWEHSQVVANAAWEIAAACGLEPEMAWLAGLLHDIGRLGFSTLPPWHRQAEQKWLEAGFPLVYAETLAYGLDHAELGGNLLRAWDLPTSVVDAVTTHHRPEASASGLSSVLFLAEDTPVRLGTAPVEDLWPDMRRTIACEKTGLDLWELGELDSGERTPYRATA